MHETVARTLCTLTLGPPQVHLGLAMFPLVASGEAEPGYLTLAEALAGGLARVTEATEGGVVPELLLDNPSDHRVLLLDGDELVGAKQNRVLDVTILVGPRRRLVIPVSCVERGRWHRRSDEFRSEDRMMFARGRASKMAQVSASLRREGAHRSDQGAVWAEVEGMIALHQPAAPTEAMADVYRHVEADTGRYRAALRAVPGQVGAVFSVDGEPAGVELFDAPRTLRSTLGRLVESYALDAIGREGGTLPGPDAAEARGLLLRAAQAEAAERPALGEGVEIRLEAAGLVGEALEVDGRLVHLSALPLAVTRGEAGGRGTAGRAAPSARDRAERLRWRRAG